MPLTRIGTWVPGYLGTYNKHVHRVRQRVLPVRFFGFVHENQGDVNMCSRSLLVRPLPSVGKTTERDLN